MSKAIFICLILSINSFSKIGSNFGVGFNYSRTNSDDDVLVKYEDKFNLPILEFSYDYYIINNLIVSIGSGFNPKGESAKGKVGNYEANLDIISFTTPLHAKYRLPFGRVGLDLIGGLGTAWIFGGKVSVNDEKVSGVDFNSRTFSIDGGLAFRIFSKDKQSSFFINPMYSHGLSEAIKNSTNTKFSDFKLFIGLSKNYK